MAVLGHRTHFNSQVKNEVKSELIKSEVKTEKGIKQEKLDGKGLRPLSHVLCSLSTSASGHRWGGEAACNSRSRAL